MGAIGRPRRVGLNYRGVVQRVAPDVVAAPGSQFVNAFASFALQVLVARALGARGFATFAILMAVLVAANAAYTSWVGDGLVVLDRHDELLRRGLQVSMLIGLILGAVAASGAAILLRTSVVVTLTFTLVVVLWLSQETFRRLLGARGQFRSLLAADVAAAVATVFCGGAAALWHPSLTWFLVSVAVGCLTGTAVAVPRLPATELRLGGTLARSVDTLSALHAVATFSAWRCLQTTLRPLSLLVLRLLVVVFSGRSALAGLELARLLTAPAQTLVQGLGSLLLPRAAEEERRQRTSQSHSLRRGLLLAAAVVGTGFIGEACRDVLGEALSGGRYEVPAWAVLNWSLYVASVAGTLPLATAAVARRRSRQVLLIRLAGSCFGLVLATVFLALGASPAWTPAALAVGGTLDIAILALRERRDRRSAQQLVS